MAERSVLVKRELISNLPEARRSQRETIPYICDFSRCRLNVRLCARIQPLLRGHKYGLFILLRVVLWLGRCRYRESDCRIAQKSIQKSSTNYRLQPRTSPSALPQKGHCRSQKRFENYKAMNYGKEGFLPIVLFMAFVLWNFDHRNCGVVFPKFLYYWAKWNV